MRWAGHIASMGDEKCKAEEMKPVGRPTYKRRLDDNIKVAPKCMSGSLLWTRWWAFRFYKRRRIPWLAERLWNPQEEIFSMELTTVHEISPPATLINATGHKRPSDRGLTSTVFRHYIYVALGMIAARCIKRRVLSHKGEYANQETYRPIWHLAKYKDSSCDLHSFVLLLPPLLVRRS
jgi:hypothetical protein